MAMLDAEGKFQREAAFKGKLKIERFIVITDMNGLQGFTLCLRREKICSAFVKGHDKAPFVD